MQQNLSKTKILNLILVIILIIGMMLSSFGGTVYAIEDMVSPEQQVTNDPVAVEGSRIQVQPASVIVIAGEAATITVVAEVSDGGTLSYQWQKFTDLDNRWNDILAATEESYTTEELNSSDNGSQYRCVVTNHWNETTACTISDAATLTIATASEEEIIVADELEDFEVTYGTPLDVSSFPLLKAENTEAISNWAELADQAIFEGVDPDYSINGSTYTIYTALGLAWFASEVNSGNQFTGKRVELANDIDLAAYEWTPIGNYTPSTWSTPEEKLPFKGTFDGNKYTISRLKIGEKDAVNATWNCVGLFGYVEEAKIQNVGIENCSINSHIDDWSYVGGLVGFINGTAITNCYATGDITGGGRSASVGGLVGYNKNLDEENSVTIVNCYATVTVSCRGTFLAYAGGLVGYQHYCATTNCYATGDVTSRVTNFLSNDAAAGGLVGCCNMKSTITNCYATGDVTGNNASVGGLIGEDWGSIFNGYWNGSATQILDEIERELGNKKGVNKGDGDGDGVSICMESSKMKMNEFAYTLNINRGEDETLAEWGRDDNKNQGYPILCGIGIGNGIPSAGTEAKVILTKDSLGAAGNAKITGLTSAKTYKIIVDPEGEAAVYYSRMNGTLTDNATEKAALAGTEIKGLINGQTYEVQEVDTQAPRVITYNPANGATAVAPGKQLEMTFQETIIKGSGYITLVNAEDDRIVETIDVTGSQVSVSGVKVVVTFNNTLEKGTTYYVQIAEGCFADKVGNSYAGIGEKTIWRFTTTAKEITAVNTIADINVLYGTQLSELQFPKTVQVTLEDGSTANLGVNWDTESSTYDSHTAAMYQIPGTLLSGEGIANTAKHKAKIRVMVLEQDAIDQEITAVKEVEAIHVSYGTASNELALPAVVQVTLANETMQNVAVNWEDGIPSYDANKAGTYQLNGTLVLLKGIVNPARHTASVQVIVAPKSPALELREDFDGLTIGYAQGDHAQHVTQNIYLAAKGHSGHTSITWKSSDARITNTGRVSRPEAEDLAVTLTATITHDVSGAQESKTFSVKVLKKTVKTILQDAARALSPDKAFTFAHGDTWECVTSELALLDTGLYGTAIHWSSNKPAVICIQRENGQTVGIVNRPKEADSNVILTADISLGEHSIRKTFLLVVKNQTITKDDGDVRQTTSRQADVTVGEDATKKQDHLDILRTELNNSTKIDTVILEEEKLENLADYIDPNESDFSRRTVTVQIPQQEKDPAHELAIEVSATSLAAIAAKNAALQINTEEGSVCIEEQELQEVAQTGTDLFFRIVPVKDRREREEVEHNLRTNITVIEAANGAPIHALSIPRKIETNFSGKNARVALPLSGIDIPDQDREAFLESVRIFIEHSDGSIELLRGTFQYESGQPVAMEFIINQFSRFQLLSFYEAEENHSRHSSSSSKNDFVTIYVNDDALKAGILTITRDNGKSIHKITVEEEKLERKLQDEGPKAVVTIPFAKTSDCAIAELNGKILHDMAKQQMVIKVKTKTATYTLPAVQLDMNVIAGQLGKKIALEDIDVQLSIAKPQNDMVKTVEKVAKRNKFVTKVPAVNFTVKCYSDNQTVTVNSYSAYVERSILLPEAVNSTDITTAVVVETDGNVRHAPTKVDGTEDVKIHSLTDSTYALIYHRMKFEDVRGHWAEKDINDMGSRMVVSGVGNEKFEPNRDITRAEFAAIVVRALGLKPERGSSPFMDVANDSWYCDYIETAHAYEIINGYGNHVFKPLNSITRQEAMAMVARAMDIAGLKETANEQNLAHYTDSAQVAAWAKSNVAACVTQGIVSGKSSHLLAPQDNITRAEVATVVSRLLKQSNLI